LAAFSAALAASFSTFSLAAFSLRKSFSALDISFFGAPAAAAAAAASAFSRFFCGEQVRGRVGGR